MPTIARKGLSLFTISEELEGTKSGQIPSTGELTPHKRRLRSNSVVGDSPVLSTPSPKKQSPARKSPRTCINTSPNCSSIEIGKESEDKLGKLLAKKLADCFVDKPKWNPRDMEHLSAAKEALHVSCVPSMIVCREDEQNRVLEFCKQCVEKQKAGSLYASGCPGTGKSLSMERVKESLLDWAEKGGFQPPAILSVNCTSLTNTNEIFIKILGKDQQRKKISCATSALQHLQSLYSESQKSTSMEMKLIIVDELDYLITRDRAVLHDLFMLTTLPFSKFILIGIANAIDLADRFLPKLQSLNCTPMVVNFRAYSKDQITKIFKQRLMVLPYTVFQPQALELCARKVAAASGDMRKALCICRSAIEVLESELRESACNTELLSTKSGEEQTAAAIGLKNKEIDIVRVDHMALALSKAYGSPVVSTIQSLPQHQQIILCAAVKLFRSKKKDATISEFSKHYTELCKSILIPPVGNMELSSMCRVLADQGLLRLGQSREDKLRRMSLKVDEADVTFALQGVRVFRNCLQQC